MSELQHALAITPTSIFHVAAGGQSRSRQRKIASGLPGEISGFTPVTEREIEQAFAQALRGSSLCLTGGLMETGWEWVSITPERMAQAARGKRLWWWQNGRGVLAAREDEEEKALVLSLVLLGGQSPLVKQCWAMRSSVPLAAASAWPTAVLQ